MLQCSDYPKNPGNLMGDKPQTVETEAGSLPWLQLLCNCCLPGESTHLVQGPSGLERLEEEGGLLQISAQSLPGLQDCNSLHASHWIY